MKPAARVGDSSLKSEICDLKSNLPLFIAFRVLFNARWYYPVLAVLFIDFGLTIEQYALLNVAWAAAIVGLEVPSGALADQLGRKRMVVFAAALMVVEMTLFAFAPRGASWLFWVFLLNRVLSGAAEASASGADEALAYDSLDEIGRAEEWPRVLERLMRWQSGGFFVAMLVGGAVYDAHFWQWLGLPLAQETTMRFPIYLTLANAVLCLLVTLRMREPGTARTHTSSGATWRATVAAGRWILQTPAALVVILAGLCFDSIIRLFLTLGGNYYRLIKLPEATFGLIGSGFALIGFFTPRLSKWLVQHGSKRTNFAIVAALTMAGLIGISFAWPRWGVLLVAPFGIAMSMMGFFVSHYLNEAVTDSAQRATILSFRGLAFNLAYGAVGLMFAGLSRSLSGAGTQEQIFAQTLHWLPWYFVGTLFALALAAARLGGNSKFPKRNFK